MENTSLPRVIDNLAEAMLGVWKLKSRIDIDGQGMRRIDPILGADPLGVLCFGPGYFAAQFMKRDRSSRRDTAGPVQGANNSSAVDGYDAYFGTYLLDGAAGRLTVRLDGSISPANIGSTFVRDIRIRENELFIQLPTTAADGTPVTRTLVFSRAVG